MLRRKRFLLCGSVTRCTVVCVCGCLCSLLFHDFQLKADDLCTLTIRNEVRQYVQERQSEAGAGWEAAQPRERGDAPVEAWDNAPAPKLLFKQLQEHLVHIADPETASCCAHKDVMQQLPDGASSYLDACRAVSLQRNVLSHTTQNQCLIYHCRCCKSGCTANMLLFVTELVQGTENLVTISWALHLGHFWCQVICRSSIQKNALEPRNKMKHHRNKLFWLR